MKVQIKRVYLPADKNDGKRVLVDRLWPRGLTKDAAKVDVWLKELGPSTELRKWFGHDPEKWGEFQKRFRSELNKNKELVAELTQLAESGKVTLVYGAHDEEHNNAVVIRDFLAAA
ncbi:MAG: DUF488 domain-containing protein [Chloracidobacterium sp.]|nr:DUF488 domain-containing protein [Chloracidobacterium sp.]MCC6826059.1 DUF488 domain-containing protein [Acidobacteriota bacterium]MCO5333742.1 DUF488 domain-containing protein [Pyrinomonadaceae bacterium]